MILAEETISRRNGLPVELQYRLHSTVSKETEWCVKYAGQGQYFDTFEEAVEYIRKRKFFTQKQLKGVSGIRCSIERKAKTRLEALQKTEDIRRTIEYRGAKEIYEIRQQLKQDGIAQSEHDANELIGLYYLKSIAEHKRRSIYD